MKTTGGNVLFVTGKYSVEICADGVKLQLPRGVRNEEKEEGFLRFYPFPMKNK